MRSFCWCVPFQSTRLSLGFSIPCLWATTLFLCIGLITLDFSWKKKKNRKGLLEKKNFGLQWLIFDFYFICTWTVGEEKLLLVPRTSSQVCDRSKFYMHRPTSAGLRLPPQGSFEKKKEIANSGRAALRFFHFFLILRWIDSWSIIVPKHYRPGNTIWIMSL